MTAAALSLPFREGCKDLVDGVRMWRVAHLLGFAPLRQRYARSRLGQTWIALTTAITTTSFGLVWSLLWGIPIHAYLPWVAASLIVWSLITSNILEGTEVFPATGRYFLTHEAPFSTVIYGTLWRNLVVFLHNLPIIVVVLLIFPQPLNWSVLWAIPGLLLLQVSCIGLTYTVALICARFRDVTQVVGSLLQIMFFLTPIMWQPDFLNPRHHWLIDLNPLNALLSVVRDPLLGRPISAESWAGALIVATLSVLLTPVIVGACRKRIIYWV